MAEFVEIFCFLCGEKVGSYNLDRDVWEDRERFVDHLVDKHRFTHGDASALADHLGWDLVMWGGGDGD